MAVDPAARARVAKRRLMESTLWVFLGLLTAWPFWVSLLDWHTDPTSMLLFVEVVSSTNVFILAAILVTIFPLFYLLVFGLLPIEHLRMNRTASKLGGRKPVLPPRGTAAVIAAGLSGSEPDPRGVLADLVESSRVLSNRIFVRASVYLIVGVLIAFGGVLFFYFDAIGEDSAGGLETALLRNAPRFGVLFFVEFIAIFFLRQYRSDMEEFRYYEAVQRKREEIFALMGLMEQTDNKINIAKLIETDGFFSAGTKFTAGESTELLEAKKLTKDETDVLIKIVEYMTKLRGK